MSKLSLLSYRGARDYYPEDKQIQNYLFDTLRKSAERFGYVEYGAPLLEPVEIYAAKSGQELVNEQTYAFTDRGDRTVAIRPEMTPSISRMVAARRQELGLPARLYSVANFMRYERPQNGREREFWQLNVDIFGVDNLLADFEMIRLASEMMTSLGARSEDYIIRVNDRKLVSFMMANYLGLEADDGLRMSKLLDRKEKINAEQFEEQARQIFTDANIDDGIEKLSALLDATSMAELPPAILQSDAVHEIQSLFSLLSSAKVANARFDITLMRGFDYYTGTIFEVFDTNTQNTRSLFGGGRYDGLVGMFGVPSIGTVGMALGATTMENFLKIHGLLPILHSTTRVGIVSVGENLKGALKAADELRDAGINTEVDITGRKFDKQLKALDKKGVQYALIIGQEELVSGKYTLKNLETGDEKKLSLDEVANALNG